MNREIKKFHSNKSNYLMRHPRLLVSGADVDAWTVIGVYFKKWAAEGFLHGWVIRLREFSDFFHLALRLSSGKELKFLQSLLENPGDTPDEACSPFLAQLKGALAKQERRSLGTGKRKVSLPLLLSHGKRLDVGLENLKRARVRGKKEILCLKEAMASCSKDLTGRHQSAACKRRIMAMGAKVLKACALIHEKSGERKAVDEILEVCDTTRKFLEKRGKALQKETALLSKDVREIGGKFLRLASLREKLNDTLVKISMTEDRLGKMRDAMLAKRGFNRLYAERLKKLREPMPALRGESRGIDELLDRLPMNPADAFPGMERVMRNRKALLECRKLFRRRLEEFESIREDRANQLEKYGILLNTAADLEAGRSLTLSTLAGMAGANRARIHEARQKTVKALLSLATLMLVLDRFIFQSPRLSGIFEGQLSLLKKLGREIETRDKAARKEGRTVARLKEKGDALLVPVKAETRLKAVERDSGFDRCLFPFPEKGEIEALLKRNYGQEKEIKEFELKAMSLILSADRAEDRESRSTQDRPPPVPLLAGCRPGNSRMIRLLHRAHKKRRKRPAQPRMEYPGRSLLAGRMLTLLIPLIGFGYYAHYPPLRAEGRLPGDLNGTPNLTADWKRAADSEIPDRRTIRAFMYGPEKRVSVSRLQEDRKRQWEAFRPVFKDFSLHWIGEGDPILINKKGRIPDSRGLECFHLFERIKEKIHSESSGFFRRLYLDLVELGSPPRDTVRFILDREAKNPVFPERRKRFRYVGGNQPVPELEALTCDQFTRSVSPYIAAMYARYSRSLGIEVPGDLMSYARMLSEDIFFSAKIFDVPLTSMVCIAHQETYFMNILGDALKSAGPFQIYQPTGRLIEGEMRGMGLKMAGRIHNLEDHITLSTFMAALHFATLMKQSASYRQEGTKAPVMIINLDKSLKYYNGHASYPGKVQGKNRCLRLYLKKRENIFFKA